MSAIDDLKTLNDLIADPNVRAKGSTRYKNKTYTLAQLVAEQKVVSKKAEQEKKAIETAKQKAGAQAFEERKQAEAQQEESNRAIRRARGELEAAQGNLTIAITRNGDVAAAQKVLGEAYRKLQGLNPTDKMLEGISVPQVTRAGKEREGSPEEAAFGTGFKTADMAEKALQESIKKEEEDKPLTVVDKKIITENGVQLEKITYSNGKIETRRVVSPDSTTTPTPTTVDTKARKAFVDAELVKRKLEDTPENRAILRKEYNTKEIVTPTNWEADLRTYMPAKAWMLELDRTKYPQLFELLQRASDQNLYATPEGQKRFLGELDGTDYFKEIADSSQRRDIKKLVGDLGFDSTEFSKFVTDSINFGWEGETLKQKTYEEVFRKNPDGAFANPTAVARATQSNDYLNMQLIAKNYFNEAPQSTIEKILTGGITVEDFQRQQRTMAKQRYGHLSDLIDQGVTLEDLAANYRSSAAKLLEIDPNQIDMSQGDYEIALSFGEEGKKRAMTTGEWEKLLRTDARYGWEKTENAKSEARSLASNIAQAFGRII